MAVGIITDLEEELKLSKVKEIGEETLEERWLRVKEDFSGDLRKETLIAVKRLIETSMEVQVQDLIGSPHWKHNSERITYRNGYFYRGLLTSCGYLATIRVPRIREGRIKFKILKKYQRRAKEVDGLILEMFLSGVSTRKVEEVLRPLLGPKSVSAGLVSKITKKLNRRVERFHNRKLTEKYQYFLNGLYYRGLEGKNLKLITTDGNRGLRNAVDLIYSNALHQLCWAHKLRNIANKVPRRLQKVCISEARDIYNASGYDDAIRAYKKWAKVWRQIVPGAVECLEKDLEDLLNFYKCPQDMWKKLRTTNIIERVFREVRRRTRPMSCFQNRESVERIIFAVFYRLNKKWDDNLENLEDSLFNEITQDY